MPESKTTILDDDKTLDENQVLKCLTDPGFDGRFFLSLKKPAQEKIRTFVHRHGLLDEDECATLGIVIEDNSFGDTLPEKIIEEVRRRLASGIGAYRQPLVLNEENGPKQPFANRPEEKAAMPAFNEKDFRLFEEKIAGCADDVFENLIRIFVLKNPNPYISRVWSLCKAHGPKISGRIAYGIFGAAWIPADLKEIVWDDVKQYLKKEYHASRIVPRILEIPSERVQSECVEIYAEDILCCIRDILNNCKASLALQGRLVEIFFAYQKETRSQYSIEKVAELYHCENLAPETRGKINKEAYAFLDGLEERYYKNEYLMGVAFKCEHWKVVEARIDDDDSLWRLDFIGRLLSHELCPERLKKKIAVKTIEKIDRHRDIPIDEAYKGILLVLSNLSPAKTTPAASRIIDKLFPRERLEKNEDLMFDLKNYRGNGSNKVRQAGIDLLTGMLDYVSDPEVKRRIVSLILSFEPGNDVLHILAAKAPEHQAEIVSKEDSLDEAVMRLIK